MPVHHHNGAHLPEHLQVYRDSTPHAPASSYGYARKQAGITQEALGEQLNMTRKHISVIESAIKRPSLDALVDIANALDVSTDDLLVDSLMHSTSTSNSEIHRLLLDCNEIEQEILTRMVKELKAILYGLGI